LTSALLGHQVDFEPAVVGRNTYVSRRHHARLDIAAMLSLMLILLYCLPAELIFPDLTYAGRPALILALMLFCWWTVAHLAPGLFLVGPQPLRWASLFFLFSVLLSYLAGMLRGLVTQEANAQNFALLSTLQILGVVLVAADGIPNWMRLHRVLQVFCWCAAFMGLVAFIQAIAKFDPSQYLVLPGFQLKGDLVGFSSRGDDGLFRVAGTATHYIEYSSCLAMALPFAVHYARFAPTANQRKVFVGLALFLAASVPISVSRTGIVALAATLVLMVPIWTWRVRYHLLVFGVLLAGVLAAVRPGIIGTLTALFTKADEDPSISGRTQDYAWVEQWFSQRPILGRGPRTLIPDIYIILDNQWLYSLVTQGIVGLLALAAMHLTAIYLGALAYRRSVSLADKHLCMALICAQVISILVGATFDSLSFTTFSTTWALMTGLSGAVWRLTHNARTVRTSTIRRLID
jgi:polysaccharide biosynthesis protein PslJ